MLAAGAIGSPHLLMLSGIGDPAAQGAVGINTRVKLPAVGQNLQDHPLSGVVFESGKPLPEGPNNHGDVIAALRSTPDLAAPDVLLMFLDIPFVRPPLIGPADGYTIVFSYLRLYSRGSVSLVSAERAVAPSVDPGLLDDPRDVDGMLAALRIAREAEALPGRPIGTPSSSGSAPKPSSTPSAPAPSGPLWTVSCGCGASMVSASPTPP
nr:GMC family oxidoreductase N-terminal domain-containing protein [Kutzneria sp. 744]